MKTDLDLITEFHRWLFCDAIGEPVKGNLWFSEWKRQCLPMMQGKPPKTMSDKDYETTLERLKSEAPAYLHHLQTTSFPELPSSLKPFPKN